jgi:hypothetical protein
MRSMTTDTYRLDTPDGPEYMEVCTIDNEVAVYFYTDGVLTGGPDMYNMEDGAESQRFREYINGCLHDGYRPSIRSAN